MEEVSTWVRGWSVESSESNDSNDPNDSKLAAESSLDRRGKDLCWCLGDCDATLALARGSMTTMVLLASTSFSMAFTWMAADEYMLNAVNGIERITKKDMGGRGKM